MKKAVDVLLSVLHLAVAFGLLTVGQIIAQVLTMPLSGIPVVRSVLFSLVYLAAGIALTLLYGKFIARMSPAEMGIVKQFPQGKWFVVGLLLPLGVTAFYLIFGNGGVQRNPEFDVAAVLSSVTLAAGIAGFVEETIFRGMLMHALQKKWGTAVAVLLPSLLFAAIHTYMLPNLTLLNIALLMVSGTLVAVAFSMIALYSGSVWGGAVVHALWNMIIIGGVFAIQAPGCGQVSNFLYEYVLNIDNPVISGGAYGIECGIAGNIGYLLVSVWVWFMMSREREKEKA